MPETGTSGSMSGDGKRSVGHRPQVTAPILDLPNATGIATSRAPPELKAAGAVVTLDYDQIYRSMRRLSPHRALGTTR